MRHHAVLTMACLLVAGAVSAATINVPGDKTTIQAAVTAAVANDIVAVSGGPYTEDVWINNIGHSRDGITINGPGVTLNGGFFIEQSNGAGSANVTIDGFTIEGGGFSGSIKNGIRVHATGATILNCTIGGVTGSQSRAIETSAPSGGLLIEGCRILASNLNGLYLNAADRVVCRGNYFEKGIGSDGLTNFLAEYNVFSGSSFGCGPGGSSIQLHYNDFINNSGRAVTWYKEGSATGDFDAENNWWGSVNGPSDALGTTETDGSSDPGVADWTQHRSGRSPGRGGLGRACELVDAGGYQPHRLHPLVDRPQQHQPRRGRCHLWQEPDGRAQSHIDQQRRRCGRQAHHFLGRRQCGGHGHHRRRWPRDRELRRDTGLG